MDTKELEAQGGLAALAQQIETPNDNARPAAPKEQRKADATQKARSGNVKKAVAKPAKQLVKGSKLELISKLLHRKKGCTAKEITDACDWPSVSVPSQARQLGIKLRKDKSGPVTRYFAA